MNLVITPDSKLTFFIRPPRKQTLFLVSFFPRNRLADSKHVERTTRDVFDFLLQLNFLQYKAHASLKRAAETQLASFHVAANKQLFFARDNASIVVSTNDLYH